LANLDHNRKAGVPLLPCLCRALPSLGNHLPKALDGNCRGLHAAVRADFIPALVNKLTVQYRLRSLFFNWAGIDISGDDVPNPTVLIGDEPARHHVAFLVGYTLALLVLALILIRTCEFSSADEADV
jgi:hypothetical protein